MTGPYASAALSRVLDSLRDYGSDPRESGGSWSARCPAHDDQMPSLSVRGTDTKVLVHCHVGCELEDVLTPLGLTVADLFDEETDKPVRLTEVCRYAYTDEAGRVLFHKVRYTPKSFLTLPPGVVGKLERKPLYRLPAVLEAAEAGAELWVVEGEKDADAIASLGRVATCNYDGAAKSGQRPKWRQPEYAEYLKGAHVVVVADKDEAGMAHARAIVANLADAAGSVRVVQAAEGKDVSDHLAAGLDLDQLVPVDTTNSTIGTTANSTLNTKTYSTSNTSTNSTSEYGTYAVGQSLVAERLVEAFPGRFLYVPGVGWFAWDGRRWDQGNGTAAVLVEQAVVKTARRIIREAAGELDEDRRKHLLALGHDVLASSGQVAGVVAYVRRHPTVLERADLLNPDPLLLNATNGTLNLQTGRLQPHNPGDRITRVTGTAYTPGERGRRWPRFLTEALADPELVAAVLRCFGGVGLPGLVRDHLLPIIWGPAGSGKSTFIETVSAALGDYAISAEPELLLAGQHGSSHPTGQMDLLGVRLAFVSETDEGRKFAAATMKRLTGGDVIRARRMRQDFVEFRPSHLLTLVTNHLPVMPTGDDPAVWRRVRVVPFDRPPATPDKRLGEALREELPAVLASLVAGYRDYVTRGDEVDWPPEVEVATAAYRGASDVLGQFLDAVTIKAADMTTMVPTGKLYAEWKNWLENGAPDVAPGRTGDFVQKLRERGETVTSARSKSSRTVVRGRRLRMSEDDFEDVSDVSDVSTLSPAHGAHMGGNTGETSETSETSLLDLLRASSNGHATAQREPDPDPLAWLEDENTDAIRAERIAAGLCPRCGAPDRHRPGCTEAFSRVTA